MEVLRKVARFGAFVTVPVGIVIGTDTSLGLLLAIGGAAVLLATHRTPEFASTADFDRQLANQSRGMLAFSALMFIGGCLATAGILTGGVVVLLLSVIVLGIATHIALEVRAFLQAGGGGHSALLDWKRLRSGRPPFSNHLGDGSYACPACSSQWSSEIAYEAHYRSDHGFPPPRQDPASRAWRSITASRTWKYFTDNGTESNRPPA
jgi:hypothetical protein